eukprot:10658019-Alexandrium_andersonii.AAC.1
MALRTCMRTLLRAVRVRALPGLCGRARSRNHHASRFVGHASYIAALLAAFAQLAFPCEAEARKPTGRACGPNAPTARN